MRVGYFYVYLYDRNILYYTNGVVYFIRILQYSKNIKYITYVLLFWSTNQMIQCGIPQKCQHKLEYASNGSL